MNTLHWDSTSELWEKLNLKTFFAILSMKCPETKQSDVANSLGITPATLSRIINGTYGDGKMRLEWISALKPYLMSINIEEFAEEWSTIEQLYNRYKAEERREIVIDIFSQPVYQQWYLNPNWRNHNSLLYYGNDADRWLLFDIESGKDLPLRIKEILSRNIGFLDHTNKNRFSFLCYDESAFEGCIRYLDDHLKNSPMAKNGVLFSAIYVDLNAKVFAKEYFAYPDY